MSEKQFWIAVLALTALLIGSAAAQDQKNDVSFTIGRTFTAKQLIQNDGSFDPYIRYGRGLSIEGSYARRVIMNQLFSVSGEVPVMYNTKEKLHTQGDIVPIDYTALFVAPSFRANLFPTTAVSPWASFGGGFGHFSQNKELIYSGTNPGKSTTTGVLQYGFGLDVRVWHTLSIRGEARDFWSGQPDFPLATTGKSRQHNYFVGGGVVWSF